MKSVFQFLFFVAAVALSAFTSRQESNVELVCLKTHKASDTCHFNFKVDGANYRFVDIGCKYSKKQDELIRKVKAGSIPLAKEWKIECPVPK